MTRTTGAQLARRKRGVAVLVLSSSPPPALASVTLSSDPLSPIELDSDSSSDSDSSDDSEDDSSVDGAPALPSCPTTPECLDLVSNSGSDSDSQRDSSNSNSNGEDGGDSEKLSSEDEEEVVEERLPGWEPSPLRLKLGNLPPLPEQQATSCWQGSPPNYTGSAPLFKEQAHVGDALLEKAVGDLLKKRYNLPIIPCGITNKLLQNAVLSRLAVAYGVHTLSRPVQRFSQHRAGDAFEALAVSSDPDKVEGWLELLFSESVFPAIPGIIISLQRQLNSTKRSKRLQRVRRTWGQPKGLANPSFSAGKGGVKRLLRIHKLIFGAM